MIISMKLNSGLHNSIAMLMLSPDFRICRIQKQWKWGYIIKHLSKWNPPSHCHRKNEKYSSWSSSQSVAPLLLKWLARACVWTDEDISCLAEWDFSGGWLFTMENVCHFAKMYKKTYTQGVALRPPRKLSNEIACPWSSLVACRIDLTRLAITCTSCLSIKPAPAVVPVHPWVCCFSKPWQVWT